jgi:hypothetical protein
MKKSLMIAMVVLLSASAWADDGIIRYFCPAEPNLFGFSIRDGGAVALENAPPAHEIDESKVPCLVNGASKPNPGGKAYQGNDEASIVIYRISRAAFLGETFADVEVVTDGQSDGKVCQTKIVKCIRNH